MNKVAVIIPVFKEYKYLQKAIASVREQTYYVSEICVVDDGSNEPEISKIVESFNEPRLSLITLPQNKGISAARNYGVRATKSPLITFVDADDYWDPDKVQKQFELFKLKRATIIGSWLMFHNEFQHPTFLSVEIPAQPLQKLFRDLFFLSPSSLFLSRDSFEAIGGFDESIRFGEDWDFLVRAAMKNEEFGCVESLTHMHVHAKSWSVAFLPWADIFKIRRKYVQLTQQDKRITRLMIATSMSAMARWMHGKHNKWLEVYLLILAFITTPRILLCEQFRGNIVNCFIFSKKIYAK